jgi:hypothetical protein
VTGSFGLVLRNRVKAQDVIDVFLELFVHEMPFHLMALILDKLIQGHVDVQKDLTHSLVSSSASVGPLVGSVAHSAPAKLGFRTVNRM